MSTLKTGALRGTSGTADSVQLHASNQSVTFPGAVTVTGALNGSGANLTGITTGYTLLTDNQGVGTGSTYTITSIPAANHIHLIFFNMSFNGNGQQAVRIGTSSGIKTADYFCGAVVTSNASDNTSNTSLWQNYGANVGGNGYMGMMDIWRMGTSNNYHMNWTMTSSQHTGNGGSGARLHWSHGFVEAGGTIDRVQYFNADGGNFDSGSVSLYYI